MQTDTSQEGNIYALGLEEVGIIWIMDSLLRLNIRSLALLRPDPTASPGWFYQ